MAARNPDTQVVIDHLGLQQPFEPPAPTQPLADLPKVWRWRAPEHRDQDHRRLHSVARGVSL